MFSRTLVLLFLCLISPFARAADTVDLALVLAVDASASVNGDLARLQLRGHAAALNSPEVADAIASGPHGAIAVTLVAWAGPSQFRVLEPWVTLKSADDLKALSNRIEALPTVGFEGATGIGSALAASADLFDSAPAATRRLIDISSNGFSNIGPAPDGVRDSLKSQNIGVNALVLIDEFTWLPGYFKDHVITGPSAFVKLATGRDSYINALLQKLVIEIAADTACTTPNSDYTKDGCVLAGTSDTSYPGADKHRSGAVPGGSGAGYPDRPLYGAHLLVRVPAG